MPKAPATTPATPEWLKLRELCQKRGRKLYWVAAQAGISYRTLFAKMNQEYGYAWRQGEREAIAKAVDATMADIWPDLDPAEAV